MIYDLGDLAFLFFLQACSVNFCCKERLFNISVMYKVHQIHRASLFREKIITGRNRSQKDSADSTSIKALFKCSSAACRSHAVKGS